MSYSILDFLMRPEVAFIIMIIFLIGYLTFIDLGGGFSEGFLHFGPGKTPETTTKFIGIKLDTWTKVCLIYLISFISALVLSYYTSAMQFGIHTYLYNVMAPDMPTNKFWTYVVVLLEPVILQIFSVITFFTTLTMQLQFIVPEMIGAYIASIPFDIKRLKTKNFIK